MQQGGDEEIPFSHLQSDAGVSQHTKLYPKDSVHGRVEGEKRGRVTAEAGTGTGTEREACQTALGAHTI